MKRNKFKQDEVISKDDIKQIRNINVIDGIRQKSRSSLISNRCGYNVIDKHDQNFNTTFLFLF